MVNVQIKLDAPPAGNYEYKVCGIEMVYINQGEFYLGDGASVFSFKKGNTSNPYLVTSEASIPFSSNGSDLWTIYPGQNTFTIPNLYPKGFNAFYCMKYEISQGQYSDFLNTITQDAFQNHYDATKLNDTRFTISGAWPLMMAAAPDRACNWLSIDDLTSYLDWSALSPITELEFEKICRGNSINFPVANECAWGGNQITDANTITPGTNGLPTETVDDVIATGTGLANYSNGGIIGPLRCGFAARSNATRFEAGASYYGAMEMGGNLWEKVVITQNTSGTAYTGVLGDGTLSVTGDANQSLWPAPGTAIGSGLRGGDYTNTAAYVRTSDRSTS